MRRILSSNPTAQDAYRQQLARLSQAMAKNCPEEISSDLDSGSRPNDVQFFVDGNVEKRQDKLQTQLEFVATAFLHFDELISDYMAQQPSTAYDSVVSDADRMLLWLLADKRLTSVQQDYISCQRARHAVEEAAREQRLLHIRFQEQYSLVARWLDKIQIDSPLRLYLNPIRAWTTLVTRDLLDDDADPPADVLFFPVGGEIATAVLELEGQAMLNELADFQPCTLGEWAAISQAGDREDLLQTTRDLAEMGLVAFG